MSPPNNQNNHESGFTLKEAIGLLSKRLDDNERERNRQFEATYSRQEEQLNKLTGLEFNISVLPDMKKELGSISAIIRDPEQGIIVKVKSLEERLGSAKQKHDLGKANKFQMGLALIGAGSVLVASIIGLIHIFH